MTSPQRIATLLAGALTGAALAVLLGEPLAYAIARITDRDIAELKGLLIALIVLTPLVGGAAGFALAAALTRSRARRFATWIFAVTAMLCGALAVASYEPIKTTGTPVIAYELRIPAGIRADGIGSVDLTIWNGLSGQGCYIAAIRDEGAARLLEGTMTLYESNSDPRVSIAFHDGARWSSGGVWKLELTNRRAIEKDFGPWQTIAFSEAVRDLPMAEGRFEIRYRLRGFM